MTDEGDAVAIDWSQIGIGGLTHDLDQITLDTVWMLVRPDEALEGLEEGILAAYIAGLHEGGYAARRSDIQRWYAAAAALRYSWLAAAQAGVADDAERVRFQESRFGRDFAGIIVTKARVVEHAVGLGEELLRG